MILNGGPGQIGRHVYVCVYAVQQRERVQRFDHGDERFGEQLAALNEMDREEFFRLKKVQGKKKRATAARAAEAATMAPPEFEDFGEGAGVGAEKCALRDLCREEISGRREQEPASAEHAAPTLLVVGLADGPRHSGSWRMFGGEHGSWGALQPFLNQPVLTSGSSFHSPENIKGADSSMRHRRHLMPRREVQFSGKRKKWTGRNKWREGGEQAGREAGNKQPARGEQAAGKGEQAAGKRGTSSGQAGNNQQVTNKWETLSPMHSM
ncbi:hypothetical protein B0H14DRAFT_2588570 [Mycena olivaceomarginata]|nr:hypothetical protein B0H14DRAFT_2588570 [Mycena olivaceomarginata]